MGDRAVIHFVRVSPVGAGPQISPATYLHWSGGGVKELLRETFALMATRGPDVGYTAARFIGACHVAIEGNMSLGTWSAPESLAEIRTAEYSHGDAGVFIVHLDEHGWTIEHHGGYGFSDPNFYREKPAIIDTWRWSALRA